MSENQKNALRLEKNPHYNYKKAEILNKNGVFCQKNGYKSPLLKLQFNSRTVWGPLKTSKDNSNAKFKLIIITINLVILLAIVILVQQSYAYLYSTLQGERTFSLKVKGFTLKLDESSTSEDITLENSAPMSDEEGKKTQAYTFSVINEDSSPCGYILYLDDVPIDDEINRMDDTKVMYQLIVDGEETVGRVSDFGVNPFRVVASKIINGDTTHQYSLRFWIQEGADISSNQIFSVKLRAIATSTDAIEEGKIAFGDTVVTTENGMTQMSSEELQAYVDKALNKVILDRYPVGSIYISTSDSNPGELFGGTWERYAEGKTLVGVDESDSDYQTVEQTGGSKNATLVTNNLPAHSHTFTPSGTVSSTFTGSSVTTSSAGSHTHSVTASGTVKSTFSGKSGTTSTVGQGEEFSTMAPYITVYMWERVA